eukprot:22353-Pyramimonas_sp.AAC.1
MYQFQREIVRHRNNPTGRRRGSSFVVIEKVAQQVLRADWMELDWLLPHPKNASPAEQEVQGQQDNIRRVASGVQKRATSENYRGE